MSLNYSNQKERFCLELDRIRLLLKKLNNPEKNFQIVHIAGTNGKGSVCSFVEAGLVSMNEKCGCFVSPFLMSAEDSVRVNGNAVDADTLRCALDCIAPFSKKVAEELGKAPSSFELLFAAALVIFKNENCRTVILECGMGGLGDATNSIDRNDICVFSPIGIDHSDYLGNSIEEIAKNKCGIIKENTIVISAQQNPKAEEVIVNACRQRHASLQFVKSFEINRMDFLNPIINMRLGKVRLSLAGCHQAQNAAIATAVLNALGAEDKDVVKALTRAVHPARLEEIKPNIFFDGAHNPDGVRAMVESINMLNTCEALSFAIGFMADKDISGCIEELKNLNNKDIEIFTAKVHSNPRSIDSESLAQLAASKGFKATPADNIRTALKLAKRRSDTVFVFGSLYMYKEIMGEGKNQRKNENR